MISQNNFTESQNLIIRAMCQIQLESLKRVEDGDDHSGEDLIMMLIEHEVSKEEFQASLIKRIGKFEQLHKDPEDLKVLSVEDLSMFRHLLMNLEAIYKEEYPQAISNLWNRLFLIEQAQNMANYGMLLNN